MTGASRRRPQIASGPPAGGSIWRVAYAIAWRSLHTYVRRPDLFVPSLIFPLVFLASFAGGLSALGSVPGFHFPAGYTAFQFVFVLCQSAMFAGLFTGFSLAFDFESGFARRLMLAAEDRRGIALGYALVALTRAAITLSVVTAVALAAGMRITGDGVDVFGLYGLAALLVLVGYGWAAGVAFRFRSIQAGPLMQTPLFLILFLAPVYVPLALLKGWIHSVASVNPATAFLDAGRGLISGVHDHTGLAFACALALIAVALVWTLGGLRQRRSLAVGSPVRAPHGRRQERSQPPRELLGIRRAHDHPAESPLVAHGKRQRRHAAAHDEGLVEANGAGHVVEPGQAQADLDAGIHGRAHGILDDLDVADVGARHRDVAEQAEHLLPEGQANLERFLGQLHAHDRQRRGAPQPAGAASRWRCLGCGHDIEP